MAVVATDPRRVRAASFDAGHSLTARILPGIFGMAAVRDHAELDVYKLSDEVRRRVRVLVDRPAFRKELALRDQLKEAAESPCPNIAEGFSRYYPRDFARFLRTAKGSLTEVIEHLGVALDKHLIGETECAEICSLARRARGAATRLILYLESAKVPNMPRR
jgi:four helix bundle protein